jgi:hypothetical protein
MDINVNVTLNASPEFIAVLQGLLKPAGMHAVPASTPANGVVKKKTEKAVEKAPDTAPVVDTTESTVDSEEENTPAPTVTIEQIRALIPEKKAKVGADKLKELLTKYNTQNVTNLPVANYDAFYNELKNLAA